MAEMSVALGAEHFHPHAAEAPVLTRVDVLRIGRVVEGRPAAVRVELVRGGKQLGSAPAADVGARALRLELLVSLAVCPLRARLAQHMVLLRREQLTPLGLGLRDGVRVCLSGGGLAGRGHGGGRQFLWRAADEQGQREAERKAGADAFHAATIRQPARCARRSKLGSTGVQLAHRRE